jgi:hypothetical protein
MRQSDKRLLSRLVVQDHPSRTSSRGSSLLRFAALKVPSDLSQALRQAG